MRPPLPKEEVVKAIERRNPARVPMIFHHYAPPERFGQRQGDVWKLLGEYPSDAALYIATMPPVWEESSGPAGYSWMGRKSPPSAPGSPGLDAEIAIADWGELDELLARLPKVDAIRDFALTPEDKAPIGRRYTVIHWWNCLYEKAWSLRGMENLLMDFYLNPEPVHRLLEAVTDFSCAMIRRAARELRTDGVWVTDDLGTQDRPMFGLGTFREFFRPCFAKLIQTAHECNMHFWLHSCGNIELFLQDFIDIGLDVLHPIQKYTMDERRIAERFGGQLCFWAGMDCQRILPRGTPRDVRQEVRFMIDTYDRPEGGCMMALGNVATSDVPVENLAALFDESFHYGQTHRRMKTGT